MTRQIGNTKTYDTTATQAMEICPKMMFPLCSHAENCSLPITVTQCAHPSPQEPILRAERYSQCMRHERHPPNAIVCKCRQPRGEREGRKRLDDVTWSFR